MDKYQCLGALETLWEEYYDEDFKVQDPTLFRSALEIVTECVKKHIYIIDHIDGMTEHCRHVLIEDIKHLLGGDHCDEFDEKEWLWLLKKLRGNNNG